MKYSVLFSFPAEVTFWNVDADSKEEAQKIAWKMLFDKFDELDRKDCYGLEFDSCSSVLEYLYDGNDDIVAEGISWWEIDPEKEVV